MVQLNLDMTPLVQAAAIVRAARPGWKTTEFAVLATLAAAGLALIVGGLVLNDHELLAQGVELATWAGAAYGVVRGAIKALAVHRPAPEPSPTPDPEPEA
jgi:hypothetical protein